MTLASGITTKLGNLRAIELLVLYQDKPMSMARHDDRTSRVECARVISDATLNAGSEN